MSDLLQYDKDGKLQLPNIKKLFLPDAEMEIMDADLSGADAMTYAVDSGCKKLLDFFANPKGKLFAWVASQHLQREITPDDPEYRPYKASHHGVWYGMEVKKLAATVGCSIEKARELLRFYNYLYPEKDKWHARLRHEVKTKGYVSNCFGRRRWFLNTNDPTLHNKIYSFIPQSTTSEVINRGWINIADNIPEAEILMQVHDSLVIQYPAEKAIELRQKILENMKIPLDYPTPIIIPADFKVSRVSYGHCKAPT